eukprot:6212308-Pleurochrysis_carterae.AAC.4
MPAATSFRWLPALPLILLEVEVRWRAASGFALGAKRSAFVPVWPETSRRMVNDSLEVELLA